MKIIGYHITQSLVANSNGEVHNKAPWCDFLFADKGECIKVLYHLDYSVACLLKMINMPEAACKELLETSDLEYQGYTFQYIPNSWFAIKDKQTRQWAGFSNMSQYESYSLESSGDETADAIDFAVTACLTGQKVYNTLAKLGLHPSSLTSPISAFNKEILSTIDLPTVDDMPDEAAEMAYSCCKGSWIECFKIGHFEDTLDFDIRSAYGSELAQLVDFRYGSWVQSKKYPLTALYGYCKGIVTIDKPFSPILYKSNRTSFTPTGSWETVLTKNEIDFIKKWELGTFEIEEGWWWIPKRTTPNPLLEMINDLYTIKQQSSSSFEGNIIKRIISGIWGKLIEILPDNAQKRMLKKGEKYILNPVWAAEVETNTRLKCAEFVLSNNLQENLLSIMVDGILIKNIVQPSHNPLLSKVAGSHDQLSATGNNKAMGTWKLSHHCPSIIISSGVQALKDKQHAGNFVLNYNWLLEQIEKRPKAKSYKISGLSPVTLAKAISTDRFQDLGNLEEISREIDLQCEIKRCYPVEPKNSKEMLTGQYNSIPWDVSVVQGEELNEERR